MRRTLIAAPLILLLAACGSQPPAPEQNPSGVENREPKAIGGDATESVNRDAIDPYALEALKDPKSILAKRSIYFDYDQYVIKPEFQPLIDAHAKFLVKNSKIKMLIQGNADERGSREYNLALGQKRAEAVKRALGMLGAREEQIESVSLGEEKPRCTDHSDECWAQNRRGDVLYTGEF